jgi:hypothetical protein
VKYAERRLAAIAFNAAHSIASTYATLLGTEDLLDVPVVIEGTRESEFMDD